jgi:membrane-associated protease RseP (regulator of RpoE activity)
VREPEPTGAKQAADFALNVQDGAGVWRAREFGLTRRSARARLWWVNLFLFAATAVTTTVFGFALVESFAKGQPFDLNQLADGWVRFSRGDGAVWAGLGFAAPLLLVLLAHEFGHYATCAHWGVNASLPYFLPSPMLFGTFGAFIRIRSPIYTRKSLFDIGIAGPIAGFAALMPFLVTGVWMSRVLPGANSHGTFATGTPLAMRLVELVRFPHAAANDILIHPMAMAAWVGLLATAMNLLPMGQLDGGHILYALFGARGHRLISSAVIAVLAILGFLYHAWWGWAAVMFFLGRRHPLIYDRTPVAKGRVVMSGVGLLLFALSFCVVPMVLN